jgi:hypothetical protein
MVFLFYSFCGVAWGEGGNSRIGQMDEVEKKKKKGDFPHAIIIIMDLGD